MDDTQNESQKEANGSRGHTWTLDQSLYSAQGTASVPADRHAAQHAEGTTP
jgi:hypothetical protein